MNMYVTFQRELPEPLVSAALVDAEELQNTHKEDQRRMKTGGRHPSKQMRPIAMGKEGGGEKRRTGRRRR